MRILTAILLLLASTVLAASIQRPPARLKYSVLGGFFRQSDLSTDDRTYDALSDSFGLKDQSPERWFRFRQIISDLNAYAEDGVRYVVLYLARHGQGQHNVAGKFLLPPLPQFLPNFHSKSSRPVAPERWGGSEKFFGPEAWECYWAMQGTNGSYTWGPDAKLSPLGHAEVARTATAWNVQIEEGIPLPTSHHVSPLSRSLSTLVETWSSIALDPPRPVCNELLRETLNLHYGDKRSPASYLREVYPQVDFPIEEEDPLWNYHRESEEGRNLRVEHVLNEILGRDVETYIAMTSHSGVINSTLVALGHRPYALQTAGVLPVVVRIEKDLTWNGEPVWKREEDWEVPEIEFRSVCPGYSPVLVSGRYENGMGVFLQS